jgi:hypothetical protein
VKSKHLIALVGIICSSFALQTDPDMYKISATYNSFTTDNIGNVYLINKEELTKYNPAGQLLKKYSNMRYGKITSVDAGNALKVLLYYKDFQQIVFLDNQLSQNSEVISLEQLGYEQTDLVCSSFNNSFWIFNKQNNELIRFNETSQPINKTGNLKQVLQADIKPNFMIEHSGYLYLNSPETGIYVFDIYGTFTRIIGIKGLSSFQVSNEVLYFFRDHHHCMYNARILEEKCQDYKDTLIRAVRVEKDRVFMQYNDTLKVFVNTPK